MEIGHKNLIRSMNRNSILEAVARNLAVSRITLSELLQLNKATVSSIVQELLDQKLLLETGSIQTSFGRKPTSLSLNGHYGIFICLDLDVDHIHILASDLRGTKLYQHFWPLTETPSAAKLSQFIDDCLPSLPQTVKGILTIVIGIHGMVMNNQVALAVHYDLTQNHFVEFLEKKYHTRVFLQNEANLAVLGENAVYYHQDTIGFIKVCHGIGLGMIVNGSLYTGRHGHAGELGHTIIEINGRPCPCGNFGCLEQYASCKAALQQYAKLTGKTQPQPEELIAQYHKGEGFAIAVLESFCQYLSAGVTTVIRLYNPETIILQCSFLTSCPSLLEIIKKHLHLGSHKDCQIVASLLEEDAIVFGGIYWAILHFTQTYAP